jgi:NADH-quinone oxidoreductase subunit C
MIAVTVAQRAQNFCNLINAKLGGLIRRVAVERGDVVVSAHPDRLYEVLSTLKTDPELHCDMLVYLTAVDYMDAAQERFELVYELQSLLHKHRLRLKVPVPEERLEAASAVDLWASAGFLEREVWDMYGISFTGHPNLRRILLYEEFKGHPLRKDYPVQGKQPRVPLRYPEVRNTAVDMARPELVQIGERRK